MIAPTKPANEKARIAELNSYNILDTLPDEDYDNLTKIAAGICGTKISLVSLIDEDRQWFKSRHHLDATETPRDLAFCAHAIHQPKELFIVNDARQDERFHDNPLVTGAPNVIFYAGAPLVTKEGHALGTLCVIDDKPKELTDDQKESLDALAKQVVRLLELRKKRAALEQTAAQLQEQNEDLKNLIEHAVDDLKLPLNNISNLSKIFLADKSIQANVSKQSMLKQMKASSSRLKTQLNSLKAYNHAQNIDGKERINASWVQLNRLLKVGSQTKINWTSNLDTFKIHLDAVANVLQQLISNAERFNNNTLVHINIELVQDKNNYILKWSDNSRGIHPAFQKQAFTLYKTFDKEDKFGKPTNGMGLAIAKRYIQVIDGTINMIEKESGGAHFVITMPINSTVNEDTENLQVVENVF